jgi:hypothetical protein
MVHSLALTSLAKLYAVLASVAASVLVHVAVSVLLHVYVSLQVKLLV